MSPPLATPAAEASATAAVPSGAAAGPTAEVRLHLAPGREKSVREGHPWLFSGGIARSEGPGDAPVARVFAANGTPLGLGFHSPKSDLRVRLLPPSVPAIDRTFFARRLAEAQSLRFALLPAATTGYRLLNAEGDGVPGWTVDHFAGVLVSQITSFGLEALRAEAYAALAAAFPAARILQRNRVPARRGEGLSAVDELVAAAAAAPLDRELEAALAVAPAPEAGADEVWFREDGLWFSADLAAGQKTGFYFDQRDNRRLAGSFASGRSLLDLFANSGAFAVHALRGGASAVVAVESAARLETTAARHLAANRLLDERWQWVEADVFAFLREPSQRRFDLVVCDPPPLARHRGDVNAAARAYKDLNRLALRQVSPGGLFLTFSCSGGVDGKLFRQILFAAAGEAGVELQLLRPLAAALDHPVAVTHPQGEYLKGWLTRVAGPR